MIRAGGALTFGGRTWAYEFGSRGDNSGTCTTDTTDASDASESSESSLEVVDTVNTELIVDVELFRESAGGSSGGVLTSWVDSCCPADGRRTGGFMIGAVNAANGTTGMVAGFAAA